MGNTALPNPNQQQNDTPVIIFIGTSWNSGEINLFKTRFKFKKVTKLKKETRWIKTV
jgi:hypothetical protein